MNCSTKGAALRKELHSTYGKLLFHVQVAEFQPPNTAKNYFTGAFQAFCTRSRRSHSKAFIYLKSLKTVKKLICNEVATCQPATLRKKSHTSSWHTRKVGPRTLRWDPGPRTLKWDPKVGP